jgi:hypothetical protein
MKSHSILLPSLAILTHQAYAYFCLTPFCTPNCVNEQARCDKGPQYCIDGSPDCWDAFVTKTVTSTVKVTQAVAVTKTGTVLSTQTKVDGKVEGSTVVKIEVCVAIPSCVNVIRLPQLTLRIRNNRHKSSLQPSPTQRPPYSALPSPQSPPPHLPNISNAPSPSTNAQTQKQ